MKLLFKEGDIKVFKRKVTVADTAIFDSGQVHPVYASFAIARDAEWACRLFVLEMKEEDEEGIGTYISVNHISPARVNEEVVFEARLKHIDKNAVICSYKAACGNRIVAEGENTQKILKKAKLDLLFNALK